MVNRNAKTRYKIVKKDHINVACELSLSSRKTMEMPENTAFLGGVVADWLQNCVINLLSE